MKTIAQQLKIKDFPFIVKDKGGNEIYHEDSGGFWSKSEYDIDGNDIYYEDSDGYWRKREYDIDGNDIYYEDSDGYWRKREYDTNGNKIYYGDSNGLIMCERPKPIELTLQDIATKLGISVEQLRIKD